MIVDKEYPATHSMSTAWYGIDLEGNVALFEFNENGPVPDGVPEESIESIITDHFSGKSKTIKCLNLTREQAEEMCKILHRPSVGELEFDMMVKINTKFTQQFEDFLLMHVSISDWDAPVCLSNEMGLYVVDFYEFTEDDKNELLRNGIIERAAGFEIYNEDNWDDGQKKWVFTHQMAGMPFYLYQQPYGSDQLMEKTFEPAFPFNERQLGDDERKSAFRLPFLFRDRKFVQIAEYYPSGATQVKVGNYADAWFPISELEEVRISEYSMPFFACGVNCFRCRLSKMGGLGLERFSPTQSMDNPTIVWVTECHDSIYHLRDYDWVKAKIAFLPIICGYRFNTSDGRGDHGKVYSDDIVRTIFEDCRYNLEASIDFLKPCLIILSHKTLGLLSAFYEIDDNIIRIGTCGYGYILTDSLEQNESLLRECASMPYRGSVKSRIIETRKISSND